MDKCHPAVKEEDKLYEKKAYLMPDTFVTFQDGKNQAQDYNGIFNSIYFIEWIGKLLDALEYLEILNTVVVMDNAKYHKTSLANTPKRCQSKTAMQEACTRYGIPHFPRDLKSTLWSKLKEYIKQIT